MTMFDDKAIGELEAGRRWLLSPSGHPLLQIARRRVQSITSNVFIVQSIPEQTEDIYDLLFDGAIVVRVEVPRTSPSSGSVVEVWSLGAYQRDPRRLTRPQRRKLEIALRLARNGVLR